MSVEEQLTDCKIGEPHEVISLRDEDEIRQAAIHLANQAEREILILSQELDPAIFGHHKFTDELRSFIHNRNSKMRILVTMDRKLIRGSHRMVTMARKFSSTITEASARTSGVSSSADFNRRPRAPPSDCTTS